MNRDAYDKLVDAEWAYLHANGWLEHGDGIWQEPPGRKDRQLLFGHAVNSQKQHDRRALQHGYAGIDRANLPLVTLEQLAHWHREMEDVQRRLERQLLSPTRSSPADEDDSGPRVDGCA